VFPPRLRRGLLGTGLAASRLLAYQVVKYKRGTRQRFEMPPGPQPGSDAFARLVTAMTAVPLRAGNHVKVMRNGDTLDAMVEAISSATETIDCSSYIYWPGVTADRFSEAFIGPESRSIWSSTATARPSSTRLTSSAYAKAG